MQITTLPKDDVKRGEIYYISRGGYNTGSEQQADRPGVIVSNDKNNKNSKKYLARYTCLLYNSKGQRRQGKTDGVSHLLFYSKACRKNSRRLDRSIWTNCWTGTLLKRIRILF